MTDVAGLRTVKVHAPVGALLVSFVVGSLPPATESTLLTCFPQERTSGVAPTRPVTPSPTGPEAGRAPKTDSPGIETLPTPPDFPGPTEAPPRKEDAAPSEDKQKAAPTLDMASLEKRLRETKAIGFFTKLSLKNQVDDLRERFRAFHEARSGATLAELRERYDLLLLKVLSLLQDSDPRLARDISASREVLWSLIADPVKFRKL
jgi:hypothetical protein